MIVVSSITVETALRIVVLISATCLQFAIYRWLYSSAFRAMSIELRRRRVSAWSAAASAMTVWFYTSELLGETSEAFRAAVRRLGVVAVGLSRVRDGYLMRTDVPRGGGLCRSCWCSPSGYPFQR